MNALPIIALVSSARTSARRPTSQLAPRVLVFSKTAGFRHDAIAAGIAAVRELAADGGFAVDATEDAADFTPENLARYRAVVFLNSSGEVFDEHQKAAFQGFIRGGGGLAAVHQGVTTLDKWPWYVALVGGVKFARAPPGSAGDLPLRDPRPSRHERAARLLALDRRMVQLRRPIPARGPMS